MPTPTHPRVLSACHGNRRRHTTSRTTPQRGGLRVSERRGYRCRQASRTEGPCFCASSARTSLSPIPVARRARRGDRARHPRNDSALPIIVISARITAADKISFLQPAPTTPYLGLDLDELQARIEAATHHAERAMPDGRGRREGGRLAAARLPPLG
ncbi:MAG: hypothetical protein ACLSDQ_11360 [Adlercreutzia equolifaciens]